MIRVSGLFWRVKFTAEAADILAPAHSPEGRFHYDGQAALYLSDSPEGAIIATQTYARPDDPPRAIYPLKIDAARLLDLRDPKASKRHKIDVTHRASKWQQDRAKNLPARTWAISDSARKTGADGMIYASRKCPTFSHLVLFRWNEINAPEVRLTGAARPYPQ